MKEIHYNQHGLLLLEGQGIYRLADSWRGPNADHLAQRLRCSVPPTLRVHPLPFCRHRYPVQAGDCIWMAPFVVQWYAALGKTRSRYIINKDTNRDPLQPY